MKPAILAVALLLTVSALDAVAQSQSKNLYRWTDEQGRVHLSDKPPVTSPGEVVRQGMPKNDVDPAARAAAQSRAAADQARLQGIARERAEGARPPASATTASTQGGAPANESSCARRMREFQASGSCYAGFKLANGGLREGAAEKCGAPAPDPTAECRQ